MSMGLGTIEKCITTHFVKFIKSHAQEIKDVDILMTTCVYEITFALIFGTVTC